jgi:glutaredoxin
MELPMRCFRLILAALVLLALCPPADAQVYRWRDAKGVVQYSDRPPPDGAAEQVAVDTRQPTAPEPAETTQANPQPGAKAPAPPARRAQDFEIVMFMRPDCGYCVRAERHFQKRGLAWTNFDVAASRPAHTRFDQLGGQGTPLIFIDGQRVNGFNVALIDQLLAARGW